MTRRLIGIGNRDRGDDAAGWRVAESVSMWESELRTAGSFDIVDLWHSGDEVVIVDAMKSGAPPGTIARFDAIAEPLARHDLRPGALEVEITEDAMIVDFDTSIIDFLALAGTAISRDVTVYHLLTHTSGIGDDAAWLRRLPASGKTNRNRVDDAGSRHQHHDQGPERRLSSAQ